MEKEMEYIEEAEHRMEAEPSGAERRPGPTWRAWVVSIIVAMALSVTATLLLGGFIGYQPAKAVAAGGTGGGCGSGVGSGGGCCPPTVK